MTTDDDDDDIDVDSDGDVGHAEAVSHVQKTGADGPPPAPPRPHLFYVLCALRDHNDRRHHEPDEPVSKRNKPELVAVGPSIMLVMEGKEGGEWREDNISVCSIHMERDLRRPRGIKQYETRYSAEASDQI